MDLAIYNLVRKFLLKNEYHVNYDELKLQLLSHPSYPSLHAITGVLEHFGIEHLAAEVPIENKTLEQLPKTFLTLVNTNGVNTYAVATKFDKTIELLVQKSTKKVLKEDFLDDWSGIVLVLDEAPQGMKYGNISSRGPSTLLKIVPIAVLVAIFFSFLPNIFQIAHFVLTTIGVFLSMLIVHYELGFKSKITERWCSSGKSTSCENIFNSKGAYLTRDIKLSDIGLVYFCGLFATWMMGLSINASDYPIKIVSILSLPITFYSIYYQYKVVKKWCPLCLGIVGILWLQFGSLFLVNAMGNLSFDFISVSALFISFLLVTLLWVILKPLLIKEKELGKIQLEHQKFKRNTNLFNTLYKKQDILHTEIEGLENEILLGSKAAPIRLLLVTNPLCHYCKSAHADAEKLLKKHPGEISVRIRFNVNLRDNDNMGYKVALRLLELYKTARVEEYSTALNEAYTDHMDIKSWLSKWKEASHGSYREILLLQNEWCQDHAIHFTPAFYVNGREWPKEYERKDLSYFIEELLEQQFQQEEHIPLETMGMES